VFESLALDGAGHPQLRRLSLRKPANSIKAFTQQRHSTLEISRDDVFVPKSRSLLNALAFDAAPRAQNSCRKQEIAEAQALSLTQLAQRIQPLRSTLNSQLLTANGVCKGGADQLEGAGHYMKLEGKSLEALGDAATDFDAASAAHFRLNSNSSVCSMADTPEWMSESDWFFH